jgi:tetratricopeptide (TPR) repeat protein
MLSGRSSAALSAARKAAAGVPADLHGDEWGLFQTLLGLPLITMARFGQWDAVLAEPRPADELQYVSGIWHYARGLAHARRGTPDEARAELAHLTRLADSAGARDTPVGFTNGSSLLSIAREVLAGEIDSASGRHDAAIAHLDRAVRLEDGLSYNEPPDWYISTRHTLGAMLLEAGRAREAEVVYWEDLRGHRDNGFALHGLRQALLDQGREDAAAEVERRLHTAWAEADVQLPGSRF